MKQSWLSGMQVIVCLLLVAPAGVARGQDEGAVVAEPAATETQQVVAVADPEQEQAAQKAATTWVRMVDRRQVAESREAAGMYFKRQLLRQEWAMILEKIRYPMGPKVQRTFESVTVYENHPELPAGRVAFARFETDFKNKPGARETVALQFEDGSWKAAGYVIE